MTTIDYSSFPTVLVYTEEQRGHRLVESPILGMIADIAGMEKLVVVRDLPNALNIVYRIRHEIDNLDALAIVPYVPEDFIERKRIQVDGMSYVLDTPQNAIPLLRGKQRWVQDKGAILAVLLDGASSRKIRFASRRMSRERLHTIPADALIDRLGTRPESPPETV